MSNYLKSHKLVNNRRRIKSVFLYLDSPEDDESSDDESDDGFENDILDFNENHNDVKNQLRKWAIKEKIQHNSLESLLNILRTAFIPDLPKSAKTFLGTNYADYEIKKMLDVDGSEGEYVYFGIANGLHECIDINVHSKSTIFIQYNVDRTELSKSGEKGFWVISAQVFYTPDIYKPFPVAIYCGNSKPDDLNNYLTD